MGQVVLHPGGVRRQELVVEGVPLHQQRPDGLEEREVAVDPHGQVQVGELGAGADDAPGPLGVLEADEPGLLQRVDREDAGTVVLGRLESAEHPGMVGAGVLAHHDHEPRPVDVVEAHRALADPDRLDEGGAARLVAHVGAVGQVVGAEGAHEQLVGERGLVGDLARGVEHRLVRRRQPVRWPAIVPNASSQVIGV